MGERAALTAGRRLMRVLFRLALLLLPRALRRRAGDEMLELYDARQQASPDAPGRARAALHEIGGIVATAVRARGGAGLRGVHPSTHTRRSSNVETLSRDIAFAWRSMLRRPGPTVLAVLTFALGIAASTAMFSVVDAVLLKPLPFPEPERIVSVYSQNPEWSDHPTLSEFAERGSWSYPELRALREGGSDVLEGIAMVLTGGTVLYGEGEPRRIPVGYTTADLFGRVLRVTPLLGRVFEEEDERAGGDVVLLTEGFWQRQYGGDPAVIGQTMHFGLVPVTIIGVLPESARLAGFEVDAWSLIDGHDNWENHWTNAVGRLATGIGEGPAEARLTAAIRGALPEGHNQHGVNLYPLQAEETRAVRGPLTLLSVASLVLLLVACGNVAALLIGAAIDRQQELAVRAALGAGRTRIVQQMLTESVVLATIAAAVGVALTGLATRAFVLLAPQDVPRIAGAGVDTRALLFAVVVSMLCGIVFGLIPALGFSRADLRNAISTSTRGATGSRGRIQALVVVGELALATVLLVGGGLLARTVLALNRADPGFAAEETLGLRLSIPFSRIVGDAEGEEAQAAAADAFYRTLMDELEAVPGVRAVGMTSNLPLTGDRGNNDISAEGLEEQLIAERRFVSANYFDVMGIRIVDGRAFDANDDRPDAPVHVVISEGLARRLWPDGSAVGRRFGYWGREGRVIGVAADVRDEELRSGTTFSFYAARRQAGQMGGALVLRVDGDPQSVVPALRQRVRQVHPDIAVISAQPLTELIREQLAAERYRARLVLVFSALAAVFALMGIYGVTARSVAARTRELGIRKALGAQGTGIMGLVLGQAVRLALAGAVLGTIISFIATRGIEAYLWGVPRTDPLTLAGIAGLLGLASILAALAPGRRASRVDPMEALRAE